MYTKTQERNIGNNSTKYLYIIEKNKYIESTKKKI